jgi:hypothetical protein
MHAHADFFARPCGAQVQIRLPQRFCSSPGAYLGVSRQPLFCPGSPAFANWLGVARNFHALQTVDAVLKYISRVLCLVFYRFQERPEKRQREESQCPLFHFFCRFIFFPSICRSVADGQSYRYSNSKRTEQNWDGIAAHKNFRALPYCARFFLRLFPGIVGTFRCSAVALLESTHVRRCARGDVLIQFVAGWINHTIGFRIWWCVRAASWQLPEKFPRFILAKVKLNLGCWIFYQKGYVNIDCNREIRADRYEDISVLPSFEANCADEIYAGHVAEHVDDVKASFSRWFEVLKPGGRITITVPDCRGANRLWLERKPFPALELGPDEGIIAVTTGVKAEDIRDDKDETPPHNRVFDESTLRICMEAVGFVDIARVDNHEAMVAPCSSLGWQLALEGYKPKQS